jgi:hypothetical protein
MVSVSNVLEVVPSLKSQTTLDILPSDTLK